MIEIIQKGGPIMYVLFLCSFIGLYIVVDKWLFLRSQKVDTDLFVEKIKNSLITNGAETTIRDLRTQPTMMSRIAAHSVGLAQTSPQNMSEAIKEVTYDEIPKLEKHMTLLSTIITVAPILGLLGTVLGLINIFEVISGGGIGDTKALSSGIAQALLTTVTGLSIAIPFIFLSQHLNNTIATYVMNIERVTTSIMNFCRSTQRVQSSTLT